jgi:hypothetical protein
MNVTKVQENPEFVSHLVLQSALYNADRFGASRSNPFILALDATSWRKQWYVDNCQNFLEYRGETYKGNRVKDPTIPWKEIYEIYNNVMDGLSKNSDFHILNVPGAEADDCIAVAARKYADLGQMVFIVASDKDFMQCQEEGLVYVFDPMKQNWKPFVDVKKFKTIHTIIGDKSDNIFPIKSRTKEKTAEKMLKDLDSLLQTNRDMKERFEFNRVLVDFDYIPENVTKDIISAIDSKVWSYNQMELMRLFAKYKLNAITDKVNKFKLLEGPFKTKLNTAHAQAAKIKEDADRTIEDFFS